MNRNFTLLTIAGVAAAVSVSSCSVADALTKRDGAAEPVTREIPWDGSESLIIAAPAEVRFIQAEGPGKVVITGSRRSVETFHVANGVLNDRTSRTGELLKVVVTAPKITRFVAKGRDKLWIENFDQHELHIETSGNADVTAVGRAETIKLNLQGAGWANLSQLDTRGAEISLTGFRNAIVSPTDWARISGAGDVVLLTRPPRLDQQGEGRVIEAASANDTV